MGAAIACVYREAGWRTVTPSRAELDLANRDSVARYCASGAAGRIDVLVNNAGINRLGTIETLSESDLRDTVETNVLSAWALLRAFLPGMLDRQWGRVVNIASVYGFKSRAQRGAYTATKAAIIGLTKTAAIEYGPANVLVNAVAPGFVDTDLTRKNNSPEQIAKLCEQLPLGRLAEPREIAGLVYWLGSGDNTYVTGQTIVIDGGFLAT